MTTDDPHPETGASTCPGCGLIAADTDEAPPDKHGASPACWELYGTLLARSYGDPAYRHVHQMVVDAYAVQHPVGNTRREIQTVALCLMTLCLFIEDDVDPQHGPRLHKRMVANRPDFRWLEPPPLHDLMTVADVLAAEDAAEHERLVRAWALELWKAWTPHHPTIRLWNTKALQR